MDLSKIKQFVKQTGDTFIFIENGEPELVVMTFGEYERLTHEGTHSPLLSHQSGVIEAKPEMKSEPLLEETEFTAPVLAHKTGMLPARLEDIRLEDLPL